MSRRTRHIVAIRGRFAALLVATLGVSGAAASGLQAQAPSVGSAEANPAVLARLFTAACLLSESLPDAQAMLADAGMVPNPETGTYFHQQFDMSVNPTGDLCSMVFSALDEEADRELFRESAAHVVGPRADQIEIIRISGVDGVFMRASVEGRWQ